VSALFDIPSTKPRRPARSARLIDAGAGYRAYQCAKCGHEFTPAIDDREDSAARLRMTRPCPRCDGGEE
jgi:DNA-directed RNA polymerase subunit RPC12/RpoP